MDVLSLGRSGLVVSTSARLGYWYQGWWEAWQPSPQCNQEPLMVMTRMEVL